MIIKTPVHVWLPEQDSPILAGEFTHDSAGPKGRFAYAADYIAAKSPRLAPDMGVRAKPWSVTGGTGIFPLFLDAGPDTWGRHLLAKRSATGGVVAWMPEKLGRLPGDLTSPATHAQQAQRPLPTPHSEDEIPGEKLGGVRCRTTAAR